jgi:ketosteroid isomerase-like protein
VESDLTKTLQMKSLTWFFTSLLLLTLLQTGCDQDNRCKRMANELLEIDREFARLSVEKGANESFLAYIDEGCVLLRPNRTPVIGRQKIQEMFSSPDTSFTLNWEPLYADIAKSGDLGYTYGIYTVEMDSPEGNLVTKEGTYVTIWKKSPDGKWKFVLDTGNQGLGKKNGVTE